MPEITITHSTTATAVVDIDGVSFLTDPIFTVPGTEFDSTEIFEKIPNFKELTGLDSPPPPPHAFMKEGEQHHPAIKLDTLPPIDAILLSHEDHFDNLDEFGRRLLDGRRVFTTMDGAQALSPRPGVVGLKPWQTIESVVGGKKFKITGTPCQHVPGGEVTGFILESDSFGVDEKSGLPNAIYFSGDTVYLDELAEIGNKWHIMVAIFNLGEGSVETPKGKIQITMNGKDAVKLFREIKADVLVPLHFESWSHFAEDKDNMIKAFEEDGIMDKVCMLSPGEPKKVY
uniref:ARAD1A16896p n=1 Tax=Blastobotrys adeninivorans TaxID=409370 RepID=A0A060SY11_BLAAD